MEHNYVLCLSRDMHKEFTFIQKVMSGTSKDILNALEKLGWYEKHLGQCSIVSCRVISGDIYGDIDDLVLQHPYTPEVLQYSGNYEFIPVKCLSLLHR